MSAESYMFILIIVLTLAPFVVGALVYAVVAEDRRRMWRRNLPIVLAIALAAAGSVAWWWLTASDYDRGWTLILMWPLILTGAGAIVGLIVWWLLTLLWSGARWSYRKATDKTAA